MVRFLIPIILFTFSLSSYAKISLYLGARTNYANVGAARLGIDDWEYGMFAPATYGFNQKYNLNKNYYATFGLGVTAPFSPCILTGVGFNYFNFLKFGVRGELYTVTSTDGVLSGAGTLGLSWNY